MSLLLLLLVIINNIDDFLTESSCEDDFQCAAIKNNKTNAYY